MSTMTDTATVAPSLTETVFGPELTIKDRCMTRACGARGIAQVVVGRANSPLVFCGHHYRANAIVFAANGYSVRLADCDEHDAYMCSCTDKGKPKQRDGGSA